MALQFLARQADTLSMSDRENREDELDPDYTTPEQEGTYTPEEEGDSMMDIDWEQLENDLDIGCRLAALALGLEDAKGTLTGPVTELS